MIETSNVLSKKLDGYNGKEVDIFPLVNLFALDTVCGKLKNIFLFFLIVFNVFLTFFSLFKYFRFVECTMAKKLNSQTKDSEYAKAVKE